MRNRKILSSDSEFWQIFRNLFHLLNFALQFSMNLDIAALIREIPIKFHQNFEEN